MIQPQSSEIRNDAMCQRVVFEHSIKDVVPHMSWLSIEAATTDMDNNQVDGQPAQT